MIVQPRVLVTGTDTRTRPSMAVVSNSLPSHVPDRVIHGLFVRACLLAASKLLASGIWRAAWQRAGVEKGPRA